MYSRHAWVAFAVAQRGWRRLFMVLGAVTLGLAATTLSTALNFGPDHALAWAHAHRTGRPGRRRRSRGPAGGASPTALQRGWGWWCWGRWWPLMAQAPADPYYAQSLQSWEQGRFIRFHGAARWVGWLWPYVALIYLLLRVADRDQA